MLVDTQRTERLMLITAHQQALSCVQGQDPLNLTAAPNRPEGGLCFTDLWVTLLHANLYSLVHLTAKVLCSILPTGWVWAHHPHKGAASSIFLLTSWLSSLWGRAMCLPSAPSLTIKLTRFTSPCLRAFNSLSPSPHTCVLCQWATNHICTFYRQSTEVLPN